MGDHLRRLQGAAPVTLPVTAAEGTRVTLTELADSMRALAADYRQKAEALDRAVAALEGDVPDVPAAPAPVVHRVNYAPVGASEPTLACPLEGCVFVARGAIGLSVHLARLHDMEGGTAALRRQRKALIEKAERGEKVPCSPSAVPDLGPDGDEPAGSIIRTPQEPPTPEREGDGLFIPLATPPSPGVQAMADRARELASKPAPFSRAPFDPDAVRARAAEGM